MMYLSSLAKLWYTGNPLWEISCNSWYSPRLSGYFSDAGPVLLSLIVSGNTKIYLYFFNCDIECNLPGTVIFRVSSSSQPASFLTLHPVWGISSVVVLGERKRYSSDDPIIHLMPTKKVMIIDHVGLYFILTIKEQFVIWKEKMFPDRRQSWQFLVEAHSSGMRVSSRSTAPH